jgi:hypothetical protein
MKTLILTLALSLALAGCGTTIVKPLRIRVMPIPIRHLSHHAVMDSWNRP